jgi:riboflavin synthase
VDAMAILCSIEQDAGAWKLAVDVPPSSARYCVEKGSIALNGISLTINEANALGDGTLRIGLTIIPHTWAHTNLHAASIGDAVNLEVDVFAKYVERLCLPYQKP